MSHGAIDNHRGKLADHHWTIPPRTDVARLAVGQRANRADSA